MDLPKAAFDKDQQFYPDVSYLVIPIVMFTIAYYCDNSLSKKKRQALVEIHRQSYYQKLALESLKMEAKQLEEDAKQLERVQDLQSKNEALRKKLTRDLGCNDWSADESIDIESYHEDVKKQLESMESKIKQLDEIEEAIKKSSENLPDVGSTEELREKIHELEKENNNLKAQVQHQGDLLVGKRITKLDADLVNYLKTHSEHLTLSFLEKAYDTLLELKASDKGKDLREYISGNQTDYMKELAELRVAQREAMIKLEFMKKRYEQGLSSLNEVRVEYTLKTSGMRDYLNMLREQVKVKDGIIESLRSDLKFREDKLADLQNRLKDAENQCNIFSLKK